MRKINPELWLLLFLVVIAAMLNFLVASQRMALVFYFLPTLYSAYHFGRRHATLTAVATVILVVFLIVTNPAMFTRKIELPFDARWFDITIWGGVLMVAGYVTGTLYERNEKSLREMEDGYDGMLTILQNFIANQKYSDAHAYRIALCATRIAEALGLDSNSVEDIRTAALLFNLKELGISNEVICKAVQITQEDLDKGRTGRSKPASMAGASALRRAIPIFMAERQVRKDAAGVSDASFEVQVLLLAEEYEALISGDGGAKMAPSQAGREVLRRAGGRYDSLIVNAFSKAFGGETAGASA
ncbi:MAG: hypothetical protein ACLQLC_09205 [Candidatus Sulfotelmatobacter sp.]